MDDTALLFEMSPWQAFGTGIASTIAIMNIALLLVDPLIIAPLLQWEWATLLLGLIASLLLGPFVFGVVGVGIWRATFARIAGRTVRRRLGTLAIGLGAGMLLGMKLSLSAVSGSQVEQTAHWLPLAAFDAAWCGALIACLTVVLAWTAESAAAWLPVTATRATSRPMPHAGLILGGVACAILLGVFVLAYMLRQMIVQFEDFVQMAPQYNLNLPGSAGATLALIVGAALAVLVLNPLTTLVLLSWWAYPLAANKGRRAGTLPAWALLDATSDQRAIVGSGPNVRLILSLGGCGGVLFMSVSALLGVLAALSIEGARSALPLIVAGIIGLSILLQVCVAFVAALKVRKFQLVHGLGAGSITGAIATIFALAPLWLLGVLTPPAALLSAAIIFNGGGVASLAVVCAVIGASKLFGRTAVRPAPGLHQRLKRS